MVTYLVHFGFPLRTVLATDIISLDGLFLSAMRCSYLDKSEDAVTTGLTLAQAFGSGKGKGPLTARLEGWRRIINARAAARGEVKSEATGKPGAAEFMADFGRNFRGVVAGA
jgi:hypothetical protein